MSASPDGSGFKALEVEEPSCVNDVSETDQGQSTTCQEHADCSWRPAVVGDHQCSNLAGEKCFARARRGGRTVWDVWVELKTRWRLFVPFSVFLVVVFIPRPKDATSQAWRLFAIFVATIAAILVGALPTGAVSIIALGVCVLTDTLSFEQAFGGFVSEAPWLIALAIFLAGGIRKTGLGERIASKLIVRFGHSILGLTFSLVISEFLLGPAIPSVAARSGGIFLPIIRSLAETCGSYPENNSARKLGAYLMVTCYHTASVTCGTFLTASHPNPLASELAKQTIGESLAWLPWAKFAVVPALVDIVVLCWVFKLIYPPRIHSTMEAVQQARRGLISMGRMSRKEWLMACSMFVTVFLWVVGPMIGIEAFGAACVGLTLSLVLNVLTWEDCLQNRMAWNTMTWIAALSGMAKQLKELGLMDVFSDEMSSGILKLGWSWAPTLLILVVTYVYLHYMFASNIAHVGALYSSFLSVAIAAGAPAELSAFVFASFSNMMGTLTHYGMSHSPLFFSEGYVHLKAFLGLSFVASLVHFLVWGVVGMAWWKLLGLY